MSKRDKVFDSPVQRASGFQFDETVANVFDDMLERSVPFYREAQRMTVELARNFAQPGSSVADLGWSTGTTMALLCQALPDPQVRMVGFDLSEAMLDKCRENLGRLGLMERCQLRQQDLHQEFDLSDASVVIMNYTLQFIRPLYRDTLIRNIFQALRPGGCLLLSEKILSPDPVLNSLYIDLYYEFKRKNGYSELEIAQKREALENVLVPYRIQENLDLLQRNGFAAADLFFRWYNFASFIALKP
jgi:tRNA (cmo5U34)-methyltransferase